MFYSVQCYNQPRSLLSWNDVLYFMNTNPCCSTGVIIWLRSPHFSAVFMDVPGANRRACVTFARAYVFCGLVFLDVARVSNSQLHWLPLQWPRCRVIALNSLYENSSNRPKTTTSARARLHAVSRWCCFEENWDKVDRHGKRNVQRFYWLTASQIVGGVV